MPLRNVMALHLDRVFPDRSKVVKTAGVSRITGDLDNRELKELLDLAGQTKHDVFVQAGQLKVRPV